MPHLWWHILQHKFRRLCLLFLQVQHFRKRRSHRALPRNPKRIVRPMLGGRPWSAPCLFGINFRSSESNETTKRRTPVGAFVTSKYRQSRRGVACFNGRWFRPMRGAQTVPFAAWNRRGDIHGGQAEEAIQARQHQGGGQFPEKSHRDGSLNICEQTSAGCHQKTIGF